MAVTGEQERDRRESDLYDTHACTWNDYGEYGPMDGSGIEWSIMYLRGTLFSVLTTGFCSAFWSDFGPIPSMSSCFLMFMLALELPPTGSMLIRRDWGAIAWGG